MEYKTSIGFTGDFSFSGYFQGCYKDENVIEKEILHFLNKNNAVIINYESPITPYRISKKRRLTHRTKPEAIEYVKEKFSNPILSLANNHMMDYGRIGMIDTLEILEKNGISYIGAGRNVTEAAKFVIVGQEVKVGIFAVQYKDYKVAGKRYAGPLHDSKKTYIKETIAQLKKLVDYVVLVYHGGDEFLYTPMPYYRKKLKKFLALGCDAIVAHHPHVVQGYERIGQKVIFYSLGNFMFDTDYQRIQEGTDKGVLLNLMFTKEQIEFEHLSVQIDREKNRVQIASNNEYFQDLKSVYSKLWATEAIREKSINEKAKQLKVAEVNSRQERQQEEEHAYHEIMQKYKEKYKTGKLVTEDSNSISSSDDFIQGTEITVNFDDVARIQQKNYKKMIRKKLGRIKNIFNVKKLKEYLDAKHKLMVLDIGRLKAKLFYNIK